MKKTKIYIPLLQEGTECYRPTLGEEIAHGIYRVLPTDNYDANDEIWEFLPGTIVKCKIERRYGKDGPQKVLVAREEVSVDFPYEQYRETKQWDIVQKALDDLAKNKDIIICTDPDYVIGYITELLAKQGDVEQRNL